MNLPDACEKCGPEGGYWVEGERGMVRCDCPRGRALFGGPEKRRSAPPVLSSQEATLYAEMMAGSGMAYFPNEPGGRALVAAEIRDMCASSDQAREFVRRFSRLYSGTGERKWPGISELRWAFCQMGFKPLDAIEPVGESEIYPDGLPEATGARPVAAIEDSRDPRSRELPSGEAGEMMRSLVGRRKL